MAIMSKSEPKSAPHGDVLSCPGVQVCPEHGFSITNVTSHINHTASTVPTISPPHPWVLRAPLTLAVSFEGMRCLQALGVGGVYQRTSREAHYFLCPQPRVNCGNEISLALLWVESCQPHSHVEDLTPRTTECDYI